MGMMQQVDKMENTVKVPEKEGAYWTFYVHWLELQMGGLRVAQYRCVHKDKIINKHLKPFLFS